MLLFAETVNTYRYVQRDLVREEAERESDRRARSVLRAARLMRVGQSSDLGPILREVARENPNQIAWIRVIALDGHVVAKSDTGDEGPAYTLDELRTPLEQNPAREWSFGQRKVLLTLLPFRLRLPDNPSQVPLAGGPDRIEVAMYVDGISVNFGPLRQDLVVGLSAAIALLAMAIVASIRFRDYIRAKQIEQQLAVARQVQRDLFPAENAVTTAVEFAARCVPAWEVGGDLYDVFAIDDHTTAFVLGDVSGKGLSAALLMGVVEGAVRASCAGDGELNFNSAAAHLNKLICAKTARERFVTLFWCTFDERSGLLRYVNAGHNPPVLMRGNGEIQRLEAGGPVFGLVAGARYEYGEVSTQPGDLLVIFSDGITEASNGEEEEFGEERLIPLIERMRSRTPADIRDGILASVETFVGNRTSQDDQTLVIARFEPRKLTPALEPERQEPVPVFAGSEQTFEA